MDGWLEMLLAAAALGALLVVVAVPIVAYGMLRSRYMSDLRLSPWARNDGAGTMLVLASHALAGKPVDDDPDLAYADNQLDEDDPIEASMLLWGLLEDRIWRTTPGGHPAGVSPSLLARLRAMRTPWLARYAARQPNDAPEFAAAMLQLQRRDRKRVRAAARELLEGTDGERALGTALMSPGRLERLAEGEHVYDPDVLEQLLELAEDPSEDVAEAALLGLSRLDDPRAIASLERHATRTDPRQRMAAAIAIAQHRGERPTALLDRLAEDDDPRVAAVARQLRARRVPA